MEWREKVRPAYVPSARWRQRPIGVLSHRYCDPDEGRWSWTCRLDCWAALTSGWYLRTQREALEEGVEHLHAYHFPGACYIPTCTQRHVWWPSPFPSEPGEPSSYPSHLEVWHPVLPLSTRQVTVRA